MNIRLPRTALLALAALLPLALSAFINPGFTPADLVRGANLAVSGLLKPDADAPGAWVLAAPVALKGAPPAELRLDAADAPADVRARFAAAVGEGAPAILFEGLAENGERTGFCFVGRHWFEADPSATPWRLRASNDNMLGTFTGDAAMLARMTAHLVAHPEAAVTATVGTQWYRVVEVAQVAGLERMIPLRLDYEGKARPHLFVSAASGDRVLAIAGRNKFADVTAASGLSGASHYAAVLDLNGNGLDDLVTWDGRALRTWRQHDGVFAASGEPFELAGPVRNLAPARIAGRPALIVGRAGEPLLLLHGDKGWERQPLPEGAPLTGEAGPCIVADFNGDGRPDLLQPASQGGRFWAGAADGFAPPVALAVTAAPDATFAVADYDGDGRLDVYLNDASRRVLWEGDERGGFRDVTDDAGFLAKTAPDAGAIVLAADLNHDGWADLAIVSASQPFQYFFNRGFRTFAEEGELRLGDLPADARPAAALVADFNGDGSQDLVVALDDGRVYCLFNDLYDLPAFRVRLAPDAPSAPVAVTVHAPEDARWPAPAHVVSAAGPGAHIAIATRGDEVVFRWRDGAGIAREHRAQIDPRNTVNLVLPSDAPVAGNP